MHYGRELPGYPYNLTAKITRCIIAAQRIIFGRWLKNYSLHTPLPHSYIGDMANKAVYELLTSDRPCMVARFGSGEMEATLRSLDVTSKGTWLFKFLRMCIGKSGPFWWDNSVRAGLVWSAGLFPETNDILKQFGQRVVVDCQQIDILAGWLEGETRLQALYFPNGKSIPLTALEPYWSKMPWSAALKGKNVLIIHPFSETIRSQYAKRALLFKNADVLPDFNLITYKTIVSLAGNKTPFPTWFDALDYMCADIAKIEFDIAIVGAGAYGMSIAAYIKRNLAKKVVHMGGATQLLFGIKGHRWDQEPRYVNELYNSHWCSPLPEDRPLNYKTVENGSYW
jgi:hypothetical protein